MLYRPEIDGLRALAVLPVILFHAGFEWFSGGFIGVDVFFVISGYLITTIIVTEMTEGKFSMVNFYERRARRILPPLYLMIIIIIPIVLYVYPPHAVKDFFQSIVAVVAFLSNYFFYIELDYFNDISDVSPLVHTWSLSIEEQFYFIFPTFLFIIASLKKNLKILLFFVLTFVGYFYSIYLANIDASFAYFHFLSRFWQILFGSLIALLLLNNEFLIKSNKLNGLVSLLGVFLIITALILINKEDPYPNFLSILPVLGTGLLIISLNRENKYGIYKLFTFRPIVFTGLLSYSLYLWHQPVFAIYREFTLLQVNAFSFSILFLLSFAMSYLSYQYVESIFRDKTRLNRSQLFIILLITASSLAALGYAGHKSNGFYGLKYKMLSLDSRKVFEDIEKIKTDRWHLWNDVLDKNTKNFKSSAIKVLITGDSKGEDLYVSLKQESRFTEEFDFVYMRWDDSCMTPLNNIKQTSNACQIELSELASSKLIDEADLIILSNTWKYSSNQNVEDTIRFLSDKKPIYVVSTANFNDVTSLMYKIATKDINDTESFIFENIRLDWQKQTADLEKRISNIKGVRYIEKLEFFCDLRIHKCSLINPLLISDSGHVTVEGSKVFGNKFYEGYANTMIIDINNYSAIKE
tara:strand:+ start:38 stop:1945 length:1908 start_codon:yes stop_codon:yes gene_type:complete